MRSMGGVYISEDVLDVEVHCEWIGERSRGWLWAGRIGVVSLKGT